MGMWNEILGVPRGVDLRRKWWHHASIAVAILSTLILYLVIATVVARANIVLTKDNTHSMTLLHYALGRSGTTTLDDLDQLPGFKAVIMPDGGLKMTPRATAPETIRCENPARYEADATVTVDGLKYRTIADSAGQPPTERRHCAATAAYASMTADGIAVGVPDTSLILVQKNKGFFAGLAAVMVWLPLYWLVYYRVFVAAYVRHRKARRRRRAYASFVMR